jgi:hypothetical protein
LPLLAAPGITVQEPNAAIMADISNNPADYDVSVQAGTYSTTLSYHLDPTLS